MTDPRLPITLITGFLGAGKTTLLNALLTDAASGKIAVVVNEFGEAALDHDLIETASEEVVLMKSGCLCCTVRGDLAKTLMSLAARRQRGELDYDRIVIETTGLADPAPIINTIATDAYLSRAARLDGVVTLADAVNGPGTLDAQFEAVSQAAVADLIVISKTDLAAPEDVTAFTARLRALNPSAQITHAVRGTGIAKDLWNRHGMRQGVKTAEALSWVGAAADPKDPLAGISGFTTPAPAPARFAHDSRIVTASVVIDTPLVDAQLNAWLDGLIQRRGRDILRIKGIVFLEGLDMPFVFHGVQHVFDAPLPIRDWPGTERTSRIVVIARDIPKDELERSFETLRA